MNEICRYYIDIEITYVQVTLGRCVCTYMHLMLRWSVQLLYKKASNFNGENGTTYRMLLSLCNKCCLVMWKFTMQPCWFFALIYKYICSFLTILHTPKICRVTLHGYRYVAEAILPVELLAYLWVLPSFYYLHVCTYVHIYVLIFHPIMIENKLNSYNKLYAFGFEHIYTEYVCTYIYLLYLHILSGLLNLWINLLFFRHRRVFWW